MIKPKLKKQILSISLLIISGIFFFRTLQKPPPENKVSPNSKGITTPIPIMTAPITSTTQNLSPFLAKSLFPSDSQKTEPIFPCFIVSYRHKVSPTHSSEEECAQHRNLIHLKHRNVNLSSLCIRINQKPVVFQALKGRQGRSGEEILISAEAGPHSQITAHYCLGKKECPENCTPPRDEFMEAIGGTEVDLKDLKPKDLKIAKWDLSSPEEKNRVAAQVSARLQRELAQLDLEDQNLTLFSDWIIDSETETPACGNQQAKNEKMGKRDLGL